MCAISLLAMRRSPTLGSLTSKVSGYSRVIRMFNIQAQKIISSNLESQFNQSICIYRNDTESVQIIRIAQPNTNFFERVVFPNQSIQFAASIDALLEISEYGLSGLIHADTIPCSQIAVADMDANMALNLSNQKESNKEALMAIAA